MFPSWNHSRTLRTAVVAGHHGSGRINSGLPGLHRPRWPWSGQERLTWSILLFW